MGDHKAEESFKSLVFTGSMGAYIRSRALASPLSEILPPVILYIASWQAITGAPLYSASKHAVLGFMRSIYLTCLAKKIRVGVVHPFFVGQSLPQKICNVSI